ncbi:hypothetical protein CAUPRSCDRAFT_12168 [Caulochytrium protostelioides]|uniref:Uncharacterized protein n=1 Tax=Caulochytrium protostelioides TaxID=1555241 RepID=A0A4P9WSJ7_9FUNG|nr:hypothetical protein CAUPRSCDRAFT_12168 [Caulochytrium protostelioides]
MARCSTMSETSMILTVTFRIPHARDAWMGDISCGLTGSGRVRHGRAAARVLALPWRGDLRWLVGWVHERDPSRRGTCRRDPSARLLTDRRHPADRRPPTATVSAREAAGTAAPGTAASPYCAARATPGTSGWARPVPGLRWKKCWAVRAFPAGNGLVGFEEQ